MIPIDFFTKNLLHHNFLMSIPELNKEILTAVISKPKIVFSCDGVSTNDDIISYGKKNIDNFVRFFNYGDNGLSILDGNKDNNWVTTPNPEENSFTLLFNRHSIRLIKFQIHTGKKGDKLSPDEFFLYGFNSRLKRWDAILDFHGERLKTGSLYNFPVRDDNQKIFYRVFRFSSLSKVAIAYIKLFGDIMEESDAAPEDAARSGTSVVAYKTKPLINCPKTEKFTEGMLRTAMKYYGPFLKEFVKVTDKPDKSSKYYDIWNARNSAYCSEKSDKPIFICFYFPYHEVSISAYHIQPAKKGSIKRWALLGCLSNQDEGTVLDHQDNSPLENKNSYYSFKLSAENESKKFRILRFIGLEKDFQIQCLDFFGRATPCSKVLTDSDIYGTFTFSQTVSEWRKAKK